MASMSYASAKVTTSACKPSITPRACLADPPCDCSTGTIIDINMSPSGKLLAVGGSKGLQVFHFNGASPLTHFTGLLTSEDIEQVGWDNSNHLYALSVTHGKLFVFTVTPSSVSQAPGSPYTVYRS